MTAEPSSPRRFSWLLVLVLGTILLPACCAVNEDPSGGFGEAWSGLTSEIRTGDVRDQPGYHAATKEGREIEGHLR